MNGSFTSRRQVLAAASAAAAAAVWPARTEAQAPKVALLPGKPSTRKAVDPWIKLSLAAYSYRQYLDTPGKPGQMSFLELIDLCSDFGIDGLEPTSYYFLTEDNEWLMQLKRRAYLAGIEITGTPVRNNFALPAGPELEKEIAHVRHWVDICVKIGSPVIRIFAGSAGTLDRDKAVDAVAAGCRAAAEYAGSKGVFLALENHGYLTETADDVLRILEKADHPWLGFNLDTGNFQGDPYGNIAKAAPHAVCCQVKTQVRTTKDKASVQPADYERIFGILRDARYRGYVALEYEGKTDPKTQIPLEFKALQKAIAAVMK